MTSLSWFNTSAAAEIAEIKEAFEQGLGNPAAGEIKSKADNCQECHGEQGISTAVSVPKLAGQWAVYLVKQLQNFQAIERKHPVMNPMTEGLTEEDMFDIASYFSSFPAMQGIRLKDSKVAREIFSKGDMKRNIPACKSCHGETGRGNLSATECRPMIAGQHRSYLREQLRNWKSGYRTTSPNGVMNLVAGSLTDSEIEELADYISGL
jgi:cytochrome c553